MLLRWLLNYAALTAGHAAAHYPVFILCYALGESAGPRWLFEGGCWFFFFPALLLSMVGVDVPLLDEPLTIAFNSPVWAAVVASLWLVVSRARLGRGYRRPAAE